MKPEISEQDSRGAKMAFVKTFAKGLAIGMLIVIAVGVGAVVYPLTHERKVIFQTCNLQGSRYAIGYELGKQVLEVEPHLRQAVRLNFAFAEVTDKRFGRAHKLLAEFDPGLLQEMKGFSKATGIPFKDVVVKLSTYGFHAVAPGSCTQIAVLPERTVGHHTLVGRNYDFLDSKLFVQYRLATVHPIKEKHTVGTALYYFGRYEGMNSDGLYVGISSAVGKGRNDDGFFFPIVVRILLDQCRNANEAIALIKRIPHQGTTNFLIADPEQAVVVEVSPPKVGIRQPANGFIVTTNHYVLPEMEAEQAFLSKNSLDRYRFASSRIEQDETVDMAKIKNVLSSHAPHGVCDHEYLSLHGTLWSAAFDLDKREVYYALGAPCMNDYHKIGLSGENQKTTTVVGKLPEQF
ncbi:MAG: C45 family autoproteolytic acyltransferase/hydrolase [Solirubrobacterales bacterium]